MTGELHEVSRAIGSLEEGIKGLKDAQARGNELFDQHCIDDDRRHAENLATMRAIQQELAGLRRDLKSAPAPAQMVDPHQMTKPRLAAYAAIGFGTIVVAGWIVEAGIKWGVDKVLSHWH